MPPKEAVKRKTEEPDTQGKRLTSVISGGAVALPVTASTATSTAAGSPLLPSGRNLRQLMPTVREKVTIFHIAGSKDLNDLHPWDDDGFIVDEDQYSSLCTLIRRNIREVVTVSITEPEKGSKTDSKIDVFFSNACPYPPGQQLRFVTDDMVADAVSGLRCFGILKEDKDDTANNSNKKTLADRKFAATFETVTNRWNWRTLNTDAADCGDMVMHKKYEQDVQTFKTRARQQLLADVMYRLLAEELMKDVFESPLCQSIDRFKYYDSHLWKLKASHPEWDIDASGELVDAAGVKVTYLHPSVYDGFFTDFLSCKCKKYSYRNVPVALESRNSIAEFKKTKGQNRERAEYQWKDWRASALPRAGQADATDVKRVLRMKRKVFLQQPGVEDKALMLIDPGQFDFPYDVKDKKQVEAFHNRCLGLLQDCKAKYNPIKYLFNGGPCPASFKPWEDWAPNSSIVQAYAAVSLTSCPTGHVSLKFNLFGPINIKQRNIQTGSGVEFEHDEYYTAGNSGSWAANSDDSSSSSDGGAGFGGMSSSDSAGGASGLD